MRYHVFTAARAAVQPANEPTFRVNVVTVARALCGGLVILVAPLYLVVSVLLFSRHPPEAAWELVGMMLSVLGVGLLLEILFAFLLTAIWRVRVGENGVTATDFWGRKLMLSWGEIETVTRANFAGLPYLKVASFRKDRPVLWLPLFVTRPDAFQEAIHQFASPQNALRRDFDSNTANTGRLPAR